MGNVQKCTHACAHTHTAAHTIARNITDTYADIHSHLHTYELYIQLAILSGIAKHSYMYAYLCQTFVNKVATKQLSGIILLLLVAS